jgi:tetratricopeptide (TPR) repeat protein
MSLLLDALKRAEEAKRAKEGIEGAEAPVDKPVVAEPATMVVPELRLEDYTETIPVKRAPRAAMLANEPPPGFTILAESATEIPESEFYAPVVPDLLPLSTNSPATTPARRPEAPSEAVDTVQREAVRNAFAVKQTPGVGARGKWLLPLIAVVVVGLGAGGWYIWTEINRASRPAAKYGPAPPPAALPQATAATGQIVAKTGESAVKAAVAELPPLLPPPATEVPLPKIAKAKVVTAADWSEREILARSLKDAPAAKEAPVRLQLSRIIDAPKVNPELAQAWQALARGDYSRAKSLYSQVVQGEPFNVDAHLGLAAAGARSADAPLAARHYRRVLEIDPRNSMAISGLLAVSGEVKIDALEAELKNLIAKDPGAASLQFSLGNLYASERRWTEAQQAYFEAWRLESGNADYLYNLAVSLDQLKQSKLAMEYYQKALAQGGKSGGQFDRTAVQRRIAVLGGA